MKVELLAPGGSYETVIAALNAGADAVYTGGEKFGARANADNLTIEQLKSVIDYAHLHGRKIYLTINTLLKENEIKKELYDYLEPLYVHGLDAVIVQDYGVLEFVRKYFPQLHVHASTQMTILGELTVKELKNKGVTRIVTPRELSIPEIKKIKENCDIEIESFVHGALCYCYSGQCLLSSYIGGRSGNRGRCAQPCRMEYDVVKNGKVLNPGDSKYVLSPKDICTLKILPDIIESGVYSLKIEGRMKKPEYTAGVVSIYRKYIDLYLQFGRKKYKVDNNDIKKLNDLFNRKGFSESYYKTYNGKEMITFSKPDFRAANEGLIKEIQNKYINTNLRKNIDIFVTIKKDSPMEAVGICGENVVTVYEDLPDEAKKLPTTSDMVNEKMAKLGNTPFKVEKIETYIDDNLFVTIGKINQLKRKLIDEMTKSIIDRYKRNNALPYENVEKNTIICNDKKLETALVSNFEQYKTIEKWNRISRIYIEASEFTRQEIEEVVNNKTKQIYIAMPYIFREKDKAYFSKEYIGMLNKFDGALIRNMEEYFWLKNIDMVKNYIFDYNVYVMNSFSQQFIRKTDDITYTVPVELNYKEMFDMGCIGQEMIIYGYMPVMTTVNCIAKSCDMCQKSKEIYSLKDRKSEYFKVKCVCDYCYNLIYNCKPLSLIDYNNKIDKLKLNSIRYSFTFESKKQIKNMIEHIDNKEYDLLFENNSEITRGHFNRGVL